MRFIVTTLLIFVVACGPDSETNNTGNHTTGAGTTNSQPTRDAGVDASSDEFSDGMADMGAADAGSEPDEGTRDPVDTSPLAVMDRPATVYVPNDYDSATAYPLVVLLHGYQANGRLQDFYFGTSERVNERGFVLVTPDGTSNPESKRFWNAYWCCDFFGQDIDDVGYISGLIEAAKQRFNIDADRVYLLGHSNGGFMSYRMSCEVEGITAMVSLAGSGPEEPADCSAGAGNTSILQIHGTSDDTILYSGEAGKYAPAPQMMRRWAERNGCDAEPTTGSAPEVETGKETTRETWENCDAGTTVELWTINDGGHIPPPNDGMKNSVLDFLLAQ